MQTHHTIKINDVTNKQPTIANLEADLMDEFIESNVSDKIKILNYIHHQNREKDDNKIEGFRLLLLVFQVIGWIYVFYVVGYLPAMNHCSNKSSNFYQSDVCNAVRTVDKWITY